MTMSIVVFQPKLSCSVAPVRPVWNAYQPTTTVARKPEAAAKPLVPNVRRACIAKLSPVRPAIALNAPT